MGLESVGNRFISDKQRSIGRNDLLDYYEKYENGESPTLSQKGQIYLATKVDEAAQDVYETYAGALIGSPEHRARVAEISKQPRKGGKCSYSKSIMKCDSAFEQIEALDAWHKSKQPKERHTFCMGTRSGDYVPVTVNPGNLMSTIFGSTSGKNKAPKYKEWANEDPWKDSTQSRFVYPLIALENARQPAFIAATLIKSAAFHFDSIETDWRYGKEHSCVEGVKQSKNSKQKKASAGENVASLIKHLGDTVDEEDDSCDICPRIAYEDFSDEGYKDNVEIYVSPKKILHSAMKAIQKQDASELVLDMQKLFVANMQPPSTKALKDAVVRTLFDD